MAANHLPEIAYDRLCQGELLAEAWKRVQRGGQSGGVDGVSLQQFAAEAPRHLAELEQQLRGRAYRFLPVRRAWIAKLSGGRRALGIPAIRDRIVQQALRLLLEPLVGPGLTDGCFAYRAGMGVHQAIDRLLQLRREGCPWIVEADIRDFFDSIDHGILLADVGGLPLDRELVALVRAALRAGVRQGWRLLPSRRGVPQGSPLSPLLANFYLAPFDRALLDRGCQLIRYADDFVVCCPSEDEARQTLQRVADELARRRLELHPQKTRVLDSRQEPFEFLGFAIYPKSLLPTRTNIGRFREAVRQTLAGSAGRNLRNVAQELNPLVRGFGSFYARGHVRALYEDLDGWLREQLLSCPAAATAEPAVQTAALADLVRLTRYLESAGKKAPCRGRGATGYEGPALDRRRFRR